MALSTTNPLTKENLLRQADGLRELGRRARRLSETMSSEGDRRQLTRYVEELETSALRLEKHAIDAKTMPITGAITVAS